MRHRFWLVLVPGFLSAANAVAQVPAKSGSTKESAASRAKSIAGKLADTAVTSAASMAADTVLGDQAATVAAVVSGSGGGMPTCPEGLVPFPIAQTAPAAPAAAIPTPGSMIVGAAKKKLAGESSDTVSASPSTGAQFQCGTAEQATAASAAGGQGAPSALSAVGSIAAATPQGMLVTGAIAAAPAAGKGLKKLGGMFGRGKQSSESMAKDLGKGRLQIKGIRFVDDSDEMEPGFEEAIASLVEALQGAEGRFLLLVPAEANGDAEPDTAMAQRRLTRVAAHLQLAGVSDDRLTAIDDRAGMKAAKPSKRGNVRVELIRLPAEPAP